MAGTIVPASPLITRLERQSLGDVGCTLSNFDNDNEPQIIGTFEIAGSLGSFASLESITGWAALANGTAYIKIVPDTTAGTCTAEFTATAPTWDNAKMGWYGTGANANHRYLFKLTKGGASLWSDKSFLEVQGKYQNVTVENDLTVGGEVVGDLYVKDDLIANGEIFMNDATRYFNGSPTTAGSVYTFLSAFLPSVGDKVLISGGSVDTTGTAVNFFQYFSYAYRDTSTSIRCRGINIKEDMSSATIASNVYTSGSTSTVDLISIAVGAKIKD